jgi:hypothetical protein
MTVRDGRPKIWHGIVSSVISNWLKRVDDLRWKLRGRRPTARFFFALPEPLPFPDGSLILERVGDSIYDAKPDDPWVSVIVHQVLVPHGRTHAFAAATDAVMTARPELVNLLSGRDRTIQGEETLDFEVAITVVEAITDFASPDQPPADWSGEARDLPPRADALNRCIRLVQDQMRAYRLAADVPYGRVTYEKIPLFVFGFMGWGTRQPDGFWHLWPPWRGPQVILLEHFNLPDPVAETQVVGELQTRHQHWLFELRQGNALVAWRESLLDAYRRCRVEGEYGAACIAAQTAAEVLVDQLLGLLMWEEGKDPEAAATVLGEGQLVAKMRREFPRRLGGNWSFTSPGPLREWLVGTVRIRNRVVHAGYEPTRLQTEAAIQRVLELQTWLFDALANERTRYPRAVLMTLAQEGLQRRGLWNGQIRVFANEQAPTEASWRASWKSWRDAMVLARADA